MHNKAHRSGAMGALCLGSALGQKLFDGRPGGSGESSNGVGTGFLPPRLIEAVLRCRLSCQETVAPSPWFVFNVLHPDCVRLLSGRGATPLQMATHNGHAAVMMFLLEEPRADWDGLAVGRCHPVTQRKARFMVEGMSLRIPGPPNNW